MYDTIEYILPYSFLISIGIFCVCLIYKSFFGINKVVIGFLIFSISTFLFNIIGIFYLNSIHPHYNCRAKFEKEARNIAVAISDYFSIPTRTQIPSISDLVNSGSYTLMENRDSKRKEKLVNESEFSVIILGDDVSGEIKIVLTSKGNKCPFDKGQCPRPFIGKYYVLKMGSSGGVSNSDMLWTNSYEDI